MDISGKVVLVTGASSGIGKEAAVLLAQKGAKVALAARSEDELKQLSAGMPDSFVVPADLRKSEDALRMLRAVHDHYGRIDVLVNNAGRSYASMIADIDLSLVRETYELNVMTPLLLMKEIRPLMAAAGGGAIINISSGTVFMVTPGISAYSSSKRALTGFSLAAREEFKKDQIVVSTVYPYITDTDFYTDMLGNPTGMPTAPERPPADTAEYVAQLICQVIESGAPEIYAHEWMQNGRPLAQKGQDRMLT